MVRKLIGIIPTKGREVSEVADEAMEAIGGRESDDFWYTYDEGDFFRFKRIAEKPYATLDIMKDGRWVQFPTKTKIEMRIFSHALILGVPVHEELIQEYLTGLKNDKFKTVKEFQKVWSKKNAEI